MISGLSLSGPKIIILGHQHKTQTPLIKKKMTRVGHSFLFISFPVLCRPDHLDETQTGLIQEPVRRYLKGA